MKSWRSGVNSKKSAESEHIAKKKSLEPEPVFKRNDLLLRSSVYRTEIRFLYEV
jgi:hypothetical protein